VLPELCWSVARTGAAAICRPLRGAHGTVEKCLRWLLFFRLLPLFFHHQLFFFFRYRRETEEAPAGCAALPSNSAIIPIGWNPIFISLPSPPPRLAAPTHENRSYENRVAALCCGPPLFCIPLFPSHGCCSFCSKERALTVTRRTDRLREYPTVKTCDENAWRLQKELTRSCSSRLSEGEGWGALTRMRWATINKCERYSGPSAFLLSACSISWWRMVCHSWYCCGDRIALTWGSVC